MSEYESVPVDQIVGAEAEKMDYEWTVEIPRGCKIANSPNGDPSFVTGHAFLNLNFKEGFLAQISHNWSFTFTNSGLASIRFDIDTSNEVEVIIRTCKIHAYSAEERIDFCLELTMERSGDGDIEIWKGSLKIPRLASWKASVTDSVFKVVFNIQREPYGKCMISKVPSWSCLKYTKTQGELSVEEYLLSRSPSDVTLIAGGLEFPAHRLILACKSPVFEPMFMKGLGDSREECVEVDIQPEVLKELLNFLYKGEIGITIDDINHAVMIVQLFKAAHKYRFEGLKNKCVERILETIVRYENAEQAFNLGKMYGVEAFMERALELMQPKLS